MHLYKPDKDIPGTQILFDVAMLSKRLGHWISPETTRDILIANIRYKPNTSCLVSYQFKTPGSTCHFHVKAFSVDDWLVRKEKLATDEKSLWIDDEFAFAAFKFPCDSELTAIQSFVDDPQKFIASVLFEDWLAETFNSYDILAYKPNRRLTCRINFTSGKTCVLKFHDEANFQRVISGTPALKKSLPIDTQNRIGRSNRHRVLAYEWIEGKALDLGQANADDIKLVMTQIFEYLDLLHSPVIASKTNLPIQDPGEGIDSIANYIAEICPPLGKAAKDVCSEIASRLPHDYQPTLIHGDFHDRQLVVTDVGVQACDFDNCCVGDPTTDLANFIGHLSYRACMGELAHDKVELVNELATRHFLAEHDQATLNRFFWNQIISMLRLTTHPFRSGSEQWVAQTERMLNHLNDQIELAKNTTSNPTFGGKTAKTSPQTFVSAATTSIQRSIKIDQSLDFLQDAFDPKYAEEMFQLHCPELASACGPFTINNITARRHIPGRRCLIEYYLSTENGPHSILGKVSAKKLKRQSFKTQRSLFDEHGFDDKSSDNISVPRPIGCCSPWNMWLQDKVTAMPGNYLLDKGRLASFTNRIASAIAKLHSCAYQPPRQHTIDNELEILGNRLSQVIADMPDRADRIEHILQNCITIASGIDEGLTAPVHRDFYQDQIMFSDERTYLVDLDLVSEAHPALDIGNFLAHLTEHGIRQSGDPEKCLREEKEILEYYLAFNPACRKMEIEAFKAISFARHIFISWSRPGRRKWLAQIIDVADQMTCKLIPNSNVAG